MTSTVQEQVYSRANPDFLVGGRIYKFPFHHKKMEFAEVRRIDGEDRQYETPQGTFPSVTTILSATQTIEKQKKLGDWRKRVGEEEANNVLLNATRRGDNLHNMAEDFINGKEVIPQTTEMRVLFHKFAGKLVQNVTSVYGTEVPLFSRKYKAAGSSDLLAGWNYVPSIIDYKNSLKPKKIEWIEDYVIQGVMYGMLANDTYFVDNPIRKVVILVAVKDGDVQVFEKDITKQLILKAARRIHAYWRK